MGTEPYVVLITGSRNWKNWPQIEGDLINLEDVFGSSLIVRHGMCPDGADYFANEICERDRIAIDPMPADWSLGKQAGYLRNYDMVHKNPKPSLCIAYLAPCEKPYCKTEGSHFSHGAEMCAGLAEKAGIYVLRREFNV